MSGSGRCHGCLHLVPMTVDGFIQGHRVTGRICEGSGGLPDTDFVPAIRHSIEGTSGRAWSDPGSSFEVWRVANRSDYE